MNPPNPETRWPLLLCLTFRFLFVYFLLYFLPFPLNVIPKTESLLEPYKNLWNAVVPWVGKHLLHLPYDITVLPNGSGDTTYNYVQVFCYALLAAGAALLWSLLARQRRTHPRLHEGLRIYLRFSLATTIIFYGVVKVIKSQFPDPTLDRLLQPFGDASPMGLLWTFMGYSEGYNLFTGLGEILGGLLLTTRRTTLLGALVSAAVMAHVVVLNFCYDVPVKLYSLHLLATALFLAAPDLPRLLNFFVLNRPVAPAPLSPLFRRKWLESTVVVVRTLLVLCYLGWHLYQTYDSRGRAFPKSPLYGAWEVEEFVLDGKTLPAVSMEVTRWRRVVFDWQMYLAVQTMDDVRERYRSELDLGKGTLRLSPWGQMGQPSLFTVRQPSPDRLDLEGTLEGHAIKARLRRTDLAPFRLTNRGFHWINEYPFNR